MFDVVKYLVGWISVLLVEFVVVFVLFDEEYDEILDVVQYDNNSYCFGSIGYYNVVIVVFLDGEYGIIFVVLVVSNMFYSFLNVCIGMMVGIVGGVLMNE